MEIVGAVAKAHSLETIYFCITSVQSALLQLQAKMNCKVIFVK